MIFQCSIKVEKTPKVIQIGDVDNMFYQLTNIGQYVALIYRADEEMNISEAFPLKQGSVFQWLMPLNKLQVCTLASETQIRILGQPLSNQLTEMFRIPVKTSEQLAEEQRIKEKYERLGIRKKPMRE